MEGQPAFNGDRIMGLEVEYKFFKSKRREWLEHYRNKYVLVKGEELVDVFSSLDDAYRDGLRRFGNQSFLVKKVTGEDSKEKIPVLVLGLIHAHV